MNFFLNRSVRRNDQPLVRQNERAPLAFHQRLPDYAATPLIDAPGIARGLGVGQVFLKNESSRLGLPAFKILGASWAVYRVLEERLGHSLDPWANLDELRARIAPMRPLTLATATDGNHGRAVAHVAAIFGLAARIFIPKGMAQARIDGIAREGAQVEIVDGTYDEAVARAAQDAGERWLIISDTSWPGYEEIPRQVAEGYSTIMREIDDELVRRGGTQLDLIAVQFGVGALAVAVVRHFQKPSTKILSVEPLNAACALASMQAGKIVDVRGPHDSIMAGLNCGTPSEVAWPSVSAGVDVFVAVTDVAAEQAMRDLDALGIQAGETGAAGLAGLRALVDARSAGASLATKRTIGWLLDSFTCSYHSPAGTASVS